MITQDPIVSQVVLHRRQHEFPLSVSITRHVGWKVAVWSANRHLRREIQKFYEGV